mgnify:CR=1 FL=1
MTKHFFTLAAIFIVFGTQAQDKTKFGIFAGPQATSADYKIGTAKQSTSYKYGFQAGANFKIAFDNQLYFVPTAAYSLKGYKVDFTRPSFPPDQDAINNDVQLHTFELGALLQYDLGKKPGHFFIKAGPTLDFQLKGKEKFELNDASTEERDMVFGFGDYGRYAASFLFQLGYESKSGWFLYGQYTHGVGSFNNADHGPRITHRGLGFSVGYYLKK